MKRRSPIAPDCGRRQVGEHPVGAVAHDVEALSERAGNRRNRSVGELHENPVVGQDRERLSDDGYPHLLRDGQERQAGDDGTNRLDPRIAQQDTRPSGIAMNYMDVRKACGEEPAEHGFPLDHDDILGIFAALQQGCRDVAGTRAELNNDARRRWVDLASHG